MCNLETQISADYYLIILSAKICVFYANHLFFTENRFSSLLRRAVEQYGTIV